MAHQPKMRTDGVDEKVVKPELLLEGETGVFAVHHRHCDKILYENVKIENEDSIEGTGLQEEGDSVNIQKETEPMRNRIRYEEDVNIETRNQSSEPVNIKGSKTVKRVAQRSVGKRQTKKSRAACGPVAETGDKTGLSLQNTDMPDGEASSDSELMWNASQEDTDDEEQLVKYTRAMESAAELSNENAEPTLHPKMEKELKRAARSVDTGTGKNLATDRDAQQAIIWEEDDDNEEVQSLNNMLGREMEDGVAEEEVVPEPTDFTCAGATDPDYVEPESEEWLAQQDFASDRELHDLLLVSNGERQHDSNFTFDWSCDPNTFVGQREVFTGTPGPTFPVDETTSPMDVFLRFFDDELIDLIVTETNKYAQTLINDKLQRPSRLRYWTDTTRAEMSIFLAILILQGVLFLPVEKDYWYGKGYLSIDSFKNLMSYDRFILLKRLLHFIDDDAVLALNDDERKLRKIWPVLDLLNKRFSTLYLPGRDIAIEESLLKWHGRLSFAQKIATKAAKVGIQSYELYESSTGYLWKLFVYTRKTRADGQIDGHTYGQIDGQDATSNRPPPPPDASAKIVYKLARPLLGLGHTIVMDNFYNSPLLARYLKSQSTDCFGTLRVNRQFVSESLKSVTKSELRVGELVQSFCRDLSVIMWRDTNVVSMISTFHKGEVGGKQKYGRFRYKPQVVLDYNLSTGGVDKKDQLLSENPIERVRNQVWYKKVFRRLLNVTILNAYVVYRTLHRNHKMQHRAFRLRLAERLIETFRPRPVDRQIIITVKQKSITQGRGRNQRPLLAGGHYIIKGPTKNGNCVLCKEHRSAYRCNVCNTTLCLVPCFQQFHEIPESF